MGKTSYKAVQTTSLEVTLGPPETLGNDYTSSSRMRWVSKVLGACGCGVFGNRPQVVAELWSGVLDVLEWRGRFLCSDRVRRAPRYARSLARYLPPCA